MALAKFWVEWIVSLHIVVATYLILSGRRGR